MNRLYNFLKINKLPLSFSLFLAILLWVAVVTDKTYSRRISVPFKISRLAPGYVLAENPPDKVVLEVSGKGRALFGLNFYSSSIDLELPEIKGSATLDLTKYEQRFNIPRNLGIRIVEVLEPKTIPLKVDRLVSAQKPVVVMAKIKPMPGYILSKISLDSTLIRIRGPKKLVKNITEIKCDSIVYEGIRYPFSQNVKLINPAPGILQLFPEQVKVHFEVNQLVERTLYNIPIQFVGVPTNLNAQAIPPNLTIRVKGSEPLVSALRPNQITALFNYRAQHESGKTFYNVDVQVPQGVELMQISPKNFKLQLKRNEESD